MNVKQEKVFFSTIGLEEIKEVVEHAVQKIIKEIKTPPPPDEIVSRIRAAKELGVSLPTLDKNTREGKIPCYRIGRQVKYKMNELKLSLTKMKTEIK